MTYQEFYEKYNNQPVEIVDPTNKNQCFDLAIQYCVDVLGLPTTVFSPLFYAWQIYSQPTAYMVERFDFIKNTTLATPKSGDIIVWANEYNFAGGHVGMATGRSSVLSFDAFEQNDGPGTYSHVKTYSYGNVLGWLRFKSAMPPMNNDAKKATQVDGSLNDLKARGYITDNDSNHYLSGEFRTLVSRLYSDYESQLGRAGKFDQLCRRAEFMGDTNLVTVEQLEAKIKESPTDERYTRLKTKIQTDLNES